MSESIIDLGHAPAFRIADMCVRPAELLVNVGSEQRELQPRIMQVLVALARASPDVVPRDELSNLCWGGRVVGDDALNRCILSLRHLAAEFASPPFTIDTIPRVGHRLVPQEGRDIGGPAPPGQRRSLLMGALLAGSIAAAGLVAWTSRDDASSNPAARSDGDAATRGTTEHVHNLYVTASNLIRTRNRSAGPMAVGLLRDAVKADPDYAPAWARLGEATMLAGALNDSENFIAAVTTARAQVRHALQLDPNLAEAHRAMGGLLGFGTQPAIAHLRRAAQLDPASSENLVGLGSALGASGDFEGELAAYRRALDADPGSFRAVAAYAVTTAEMGDRAKAESITRRALPVKDVQRDLLLGKIAWIFGDYSTAIRLWTAVEASGSARWSGSARRFRDEGEQFLKLGVGALVSIPRPLGQRHLGRIGMTEAPSSAQWKVRNRDALAAAVYRDENHVGAKLMANGGRWRELVEAYDGPGGLAGIRTGQPLRMDQVTEVPLAILALRSAGRSREADRLLAEADSHLASAYGRGQVPMWLDVVRAEILAVQGRNDAALGALSRAIDRGWRIGGSVDLADLQDEPAFAALLDDPRFQRLRRRLAAEVDRERRETQALPNT